MTDTMYEKLSEALQGSEYEDIISDSNFREFTKFFKIEDRDMGVLYTGWYEGINITIFENGNVFVANYLTGSAETY